MRKYKTTELKGFNPKIDKTMKWYESFFSSELAKMINTEKQGFFRFVYYPIFETSTHLVYENEKTLARIYREKI